MKFGAIVLAAGASTRFGRNKLLLPFGDVCVLQHTLRRLQPAKLDQVVVVTGHEHERVTAVLPTNVEVVHNPRYRTGEMTSSIKHGLGKMRDDISYAFVVLGDQPLLPTDLLVSMAARVSQTQHKAWVPQCGDQRGHPVLFPRALWPAIQGLQINQTPREVLQAHAAQVQVVLWHDPVITMDVDTPEAYAALLHRAGYS